MLFLLNKDLATNKVLILYSVLLFYLQFEEFFFNPDGPNYIQFFFNPDWIKLYGIPGTGSPPGLWICGFDPETLIKNIFEIWEIPVIVTSMMFKIEIVIGCYILKSFNRLYKPYMKYIIIHAFALFDFKNIFYLIKKRHWSWRLNEVENQK